VFASAATIGARLHADRSARRGGLIHVGSSASWRRARCSFDERERDAPKRWRSRRPAIDSRHSALVRAPRARHGDRAVRSARNGGRHGRTSAARSTYAIASPFGVPGRVRSVVARTRVPC
jgi:hypothetical protein